ncbi:hypothetical protein SAMN05216296_1373 [Pseudomonas pohangensis]|uniref:Uncharacterized protein n=1 Tax=Pseudomonas pohangensis TaxID=364197 RepID=A0A1H2F827_9PSED|nr:hypothetical protein [Pseudomonas pohangensis]SDU03128.1 hypothetical protein SAMN05216296_1373 [Pseudomonas pohangensis]
MLARKIATLTIIAIILGHAIGNFSFISELSGLINLTPSSKGVSSKINSTAAAGLSLSIIFCLISAVIYSLLSKDDYTAIQVFEWYGCLIFGGALFLFFYWITLNVWSSDFPDIQYGRGARALYRVSLRSELWLGLVSFPLFLMGNLGLYLIVKIPFSLSNPSSQSDSRS